MNAGQQFRLRGTARPRDARHMLNEICEHFIEHAEVQRDGDYVLMKSPGGTAAIRRDAGCLLIELTCETQVALNMSRIMLAEHLFYFAGGDPLELSWSEPSSLASLPNLHEVTVVSTEDVTPRMRRVRLACADVAPFVGGEMHVRILVPPKGRAPVWPGFREDGRIAWPEADDRLLVRVYTIRAVDVERKELWIDFLQHPMPDAATPGADFARDAQPGDMIALVGPGAGGLPDASTILLIGDESALPAIARIAAEVPAGTRMRAIIEVHDEAEEQPLPSAGALEVRWLHRRHYPVGAEGRLAKEAMQAIASMDDGTYVWAACEKEDIRSIRANLKSRGHDKKSMYVAWYWERDPH